MIKTTNCVLLVTYKCSLPQTIKKWIVVVKLMEIKFSIFLNFFDVISIIFRCFFLCFVLLYHVFSIFLLFNVLSFYVSS